MVEETTSSYDLRIRIRFMDFFFYLSFLVILLSCLVYVKVSSTKTNHEAQKNIDEKPLPEPAGAWPLIGHLHLLPPTKPLHETLSVMADANGPAFFLRLGLKKALVISHWEVAKECFTTHDKIFSTRPRSLATKIMAYDNCVLGFAPYGPYWREIRKLATVELLSSHRLEVLKHVRDFEVKSLIKELYEKWVASGGRRPVMVEMKEKITELSTNIILRIVAGIRTDQEMRRCSKAMGEFMHLAGLLMVSDAIPFLGWIDTLRGYKRQMKNSAKEMDCVFGRMVDEHRQKRDAGGNKDAGYHDFIDVMLSVMDDAGHKADTVIKATCFSMILGGNDTTSITLTWAISLLLNNRHTLKKAREELEVFVGQNRQVEESDIRNLVYLQAIVKETLRLYPALPLSVSKEAMEDCTVAGFRIPKGTQLIVNLRKLHYDPTVWPDPSSFRPERFLEDRANWDVRGKHFELLPFGSGRRICPGITFSQQVLHLTLARLIHSFDMRTLSDGQICMTESIGLSCPKAGPVEVLLTPRLKATIYK